jgi:hypothetical protein
MENPQAELKSIAQEVEVRHRVIEDVLKNKNDSLKC